MEADTNLLLQLTSFIGREREMAQVKRLLSTTRLLTLTGAGGGGKTRLALKVADDLRHEFPNGVWFVDLAPLTDSALVPQSIASAFGIRQIGSTPLTELLENYLHSKNLLLLLDNCEHLITACAQLAEQLLHACPQLKILATSREPLAISGETVYQVPTLSLPEPNASSLTQLLNSEAVRLFVERARAVKPDFALTEQNSRPVVYICQRLDGIPLAIELAAARAKLLKVENLATRLDDRFNLLTSGSRTALPRHQTLRATIDWSYALLPEEARVLFRRLAVFTGSFTFEAAEQVCSNEPLSPRAVLDGLARLVDRSLIIADQRYEEERYRMLETIRQYAREKLSESGESERVHNRHLEFFLQMAEEVGPKLHSAEQVIWLNRLEREHDNMRAAIAWSSSIESRDDRALKLVGALGRFWEMRGYFREGRDYLSAALSKVTVPGGAAHAKALWAAGNLAFEVSDFPTSRSLLEQSVSLYRELGPSERRGLAEALRQLGYTMTEMGNHAMALPLIMEGLGIMRELKDDTGTARALRQLGWAAVRSGDFEHAVQYFEEALHYFRQAGNKYEMSLNLSGLADVRFHQGDYESATVLEQESLKLAREVGYTWRVPASLGSLARIAIREGDLKKAATLLGESVRLRREIGEQGGTAWCLEKFAEIAFIQAHHESSPRRSEDLRRAARLYGASATLRASIGSTVDLIDKPEYERHLDLLRKQLGKVTFDATWAEGQAMTLEQAIEHALEAAIPREQLMKQAFGGLTERERQVAGLIAQGKSNREIAEAMTVGVKTVETYVTRILNKLGFDSRVQIATWMTQKGLEKKEPK